MARLTNDTYTKVENRLKKIVDTFIEEYDNNYFFSREDAADCFSLRIIEGLIEEGVIEEPQLEPTPFPLKGAE